MRMTQETQQAALAELTIFLRKIQITRNLSDLELLEVLNAAGADLLKQTLQDQDVTTVIPKIPAALPPKLRSRFKRPVGNDIVDLAEYVDSLKESP